MAHEMYWAVNSHRERPERESVLSFASYGTWCHGVKSEQLTHLRTAPLAAGGHGAYAMCCVTPRCMPEVLIQALDAAYSMTFYFLSNRKLRHVVGATVNPSPGSKGSPHGALASSGCNKLKLGSEVLRG